MEKSARETVDDILLGCVNERLPLPTSSNAGFMKKTQAIAEIWAGVDKAWAAIYNVTEQQLGPYVVRRLNAQRYARQVLRAKEFIAFCGSKRNYTEPTRQRLIDFYAKNSWSTDEDLKIVSFLTSSI